MPCAKFVVSSPIPNTFRAEKVKGMFDVDMKEVRKEFDVNIPIEGENWNIGLIVGASGTGKTTIAKQVFPDFFFFQGYKWEKETFLDDFPESLSPKEITEALSKVGFASPPDWLKPFGVLSNGQKMRAELARLVLQEERPVIFDEFTSVVDRQVAKVGSSAIQRFVRKQNKQFVAVSCHYDIAEWLEPDWIYDVNKHQFQRGSLRRPPIEIIIRKAHRSEWREFMEFHYLSHDHNKATHCYVAKAMGQKAAWCSVIHFPHPSAKNIKRIHRVVVKPDFQGIGLGNRLITEIAQRYASDGYRMRLTTSSPAFIGGLQRHDNWCLVRKPGRIKRAKEGKASMQRSVSSDRLTASFEFVSPNIAEVDSS